MRPLHALDVARTIDKKLDLISRDAGHVLVFAAREGAASPWGPHRPVHPALDAAIRAAQLQPGHPVYDGEYYFACGKNKDVSCVATYQIELFVDGAGNVQRMKWSHPML